MLSLGTRLDLVKQVGSPSQLDATYRFSEWRGPLAIGHTRMSTESRIDLSHSQPFWSAWRPRRRHGPQRPRHQLPSASPSLRAAGVAFYTDNDSEVIGVYLRDRLAQGQLPG